MSVVEAEKISKIFSPSKEAPALEVLKEVFFEAKGGESVAIMGKSGEGKTTLLHILGTLDTPTSGQVRICGKIPTPTELAQFRNRHIGFVFQAYHLFEDFSVWDNLTMPIRVGRRSLSQFKRRGEMLLYQVGLQGKEKLRAKFLSGGEKQRLAIARALANEPELILADEPTGNLDQIHAKGVQDLLLGAAKSHGSALVVVTHDPQFAHKCSRVLFLKQGRLYNPRA